MIDEEIKQLLQKNLEYSKETHKMLMKIRHYIFMQHIMNILKIILIVVPIVFAIFFAVPYLRETIKVYQSMMSEFNSATGSGAVYNGVFELLKK
ncbi:MAG: hypothetical protein UT02_C0065G0005 [Parcubacteria group bacterium GW2011_GWC2_38_7]|nr:MAG: hypothetical protein UT02_C0065G0005 [Parcubacteria group bacterium GW2011_GWC2_38_7]